MDAMSDDGPNTELHLTVGRVPAIEQSGRQDGTAKPLSWLPLRVACAPQTSAGLPVTVEKLRNVLAATSSSCFGAQRASLVLLGAWTVKLREKHIVASESIGRGRHNQPQDAVRPPDASDALGSCDSENPVSTVGDLDAHTVRVSAYSMDSRGRKHGQR